MKHAIYLVAVDLRILSSINSQFYFFNFQKGWIKIIRQAVGQVAVFFV